MHFHTNHMYCTRPCWGKSHTMYWCSFMVTIKRITEGKSYHDEPEQDWTNLLEEFSFFDKEEYKRSVDFYKEKGYKINDLHLRIFAQRTGHRLKPEVVNWLNENVKTRKDSTYPQGWCCGDSSYLATDGLGVSIFFHRRSDAMAFIKEWSTHKKPTTYFDYFRGIRKELNLETNKLVSVEEFTY